MNVYSIGEDSEGKNFSIQLLKLTVGQGYVEMVTVRSLRSQQNADGRLDD